MWSDLRSMWEDISVFLRTRKVYLVSLFPTPSELKLELPLVFYGSKNDGCIKPASHTNQLFLDGQHVLHMRFIHKLGLAGISLRPVPVNGQFALTGQIFSKPVKV